MSGSAGIVSINVIYPKKGCQQRALEVLRDVVARVRAGGFGVVRTRLYRSLDGRTLASHAEWRSKSQYDAVLRDDEFVRRFNRLRELGIFESHVYEVADDVYAVLVDGDQAETRQMPSATALTSGVSMLARDSDDPGGGR